MYKERNENLATAARRYKMLLQQRRDREHRANVQQAAYVQRSNVEKKSDMPREGQ